MMNKICMNVNFIKNTFYMNYLFFASRKLQPLGFNKFAILNANIDELKKINHKTL